MILDATTRLIQLKLAGAVTTREMDINPSWVDWSTLSQGVLDENTTPSAQYPLHSNGTTAVTIIPSPGLATTRRHAKDIYICNRDTVAATIILQYYDGTNADEFGEFTLDPGDVLQYVDGEGWSVITKTGAVKTGTIALTHNILSATHGDAVVASVVAGDLLYGNGTPKWDRLPVGANGRLLYVSSGLPAWSDSKLSYDGTTFQTGDHKPAADNTYVLGTSALRWSSISATALHLYGAADSSIVEDTTSIADGASKYHTVLSDGTHNWFNTAGDSSPIFWIGGSTKSGLLVWQHIGAPSIKTQMWVGSNGPVVGADGIISMLGPTANAGQQPASWYMYSWDLHGASIFGIDNNVYDAVIGTTTQSGTKGGVLLQPANNITRVNNGLSAQKFRVFNKDDSGGNTEQFDIDWAASANICNLWTSKAGTGSVRVLQLGVGGTGYWKIDTSGNLIPVTDNASNFGSQSFRIAAISSTALHLYGAADSSIVEDTTAIADGASKYHTVLSDGTHSWFQAAGDANPSFWIGGGASSGILKWGPGGGTALQTQMWVGSNGPVSTVQGVISIIGPAGTGAEIDLWDPTAAKYSFIRTGNVSPFNLTIGAPIGVGNGSIILSPGPNSTVEQRSTTNAQALYIYNTYSSSSNYERLEFNWFVHTNIATIQTNQSAPGVARALQLGVGGTSYWQIDTNGNWIAVTDATNDWGDATHRPRDLRISRDFYIGGKVQGNLTVVGNLLSSADGSNSVGTAAVRWLSMSAEHYYVYAVASDANPSSDLSSASLAMGPGGASALDLFVVRDGGHIAALKDGANVNEWRVYGNTTGPKYATMRHDGTNAFFSEVGGGEVIIETGGSQRWHISSTGLYPNNDGTYSFGDATHRATNGFFSGYLAAGSSVSGTGAIRLQNGSGYVNWRNAAGTQDIGIQVDGVDRLITNGGTVYPTNIAWWTNTSTGLTVTGSTEIDLTLGSANGVFLTSNLWEQKNGANAQQSNLYNTYTSGTNFERFEALWSSNIAYLQTNKGSGGGSARELRIGTVGTAALTFFVGNSNSWQINTSSNFLPITDNSYNLGDTSNRPAKIYWGGQALAPAGAVGTPSYSFSANNTTGFYDGASVIRLAIAGTQIHAWDATSYYLISDSATIQLGAAQDVRLARDGAPAILALKNGTTAQEFRVYGTTAGPHYLQIYNSGTYGLIRTVGNDNLYFGINGGTHWFIDAANSAAWTPNSDNTADGGSPSARLRSLYAGIALIVGTSPATTGVLRTPNATAINFLSQDGLSNKTLVESLTRNSVNDCVRIGGGSAGVIGVTRTKTSMPTTSDLLDGEFAVFTDSVRGEAYVWLNWGGTMMAAKFDVVSY